MRTYLIHYHEIGLKRGNRRLFEDRLLAGIRYATRGLGVARVRRLYGRLRLEQHSRGDAEALEERLVRLPGIAHVDPVEICPWDLDEVRAAVRRSAQEGDFRTFAVRSRRVEKSFPLSSMELNRDLGGVVLDASDARVDLGRPERTIHVLVLNRDVYVYHRRLPGPGGLPIGSSGKVALLLSGGIDSPVAGECLLGRGCELHFVHFHSAPFTDRSSQRKAEDLARHLSRHRYPGRLHLVPLGEIQRRIVAEAPAAYRVILYRRWMLRLAERVARAESCLALATGESVGQVASQTVENIALLDGTVELPILRPLVALSKQEIVDRAQRAGTYSISIEPDSDCCSYLLPRNPVTRGRRQELAAIEESLELGELEATALDDAVVVDLAEADVRPLRAAAAEPAAPGPGADRPVDIGALRGADGGEEDSCASG